MESDAAIQQLDTTLLRLTMTDDSRLQHVLSLLLPRLLDMASPTDPPALTAKLMDVLSHVNKRIDGQPTMLLPVSELLARIDAPSPLTSNLALMYCRKGIERETTATRLEQLPQLFQKLTTLPPSKHGALMALFISVAPAMADAVAHLEQRPKFAAVAAADVAGPFLSWCYQFLAYSRPPVKLPPGAPAELPPPGVSVAQHASMSQLYTVAATPDLFVNHQLAIVKVLGGGLFSSEQVLPHAILAKCSVFESVAALAEDWLKRLKDADLEQEALVGQLMEMLTGTADNTVAALPGTVKQLVLTYVAKSKRAVSNLPILSKIVFDSWFAAETSWKLRLAATRALNAALQSVAPGGLGTIAVVHQQGLVKLLGVGGVALRGPAPGAAGSSVAAQQAASGRAAVERSTVLQTLEAAYSCLALLAHKSPGLYATKLAVPKLLFKQLSEADHSLQLSIVEALGAIGAASAGTIAADSMDELLAMLWDASGSSEARCRQAALEWAVRHVPFSNVRARCLCMRLAGDERTEIRQAARAGLRPPSPSAAYPDLQDLCTGLVSAPTGVPLYQSFKCAALAACLNFIDTALTEFQKPSHDDRAKLFSAPDLVSTLSSMIDFALHVEPSAPDAATANDAAAKMLQRVAAASSETVFGWYGNNLPWVTEWLASLSSFVRQAFADVIGRMAVHMSLESNIAIVQQLVRQSGASGAAAMDRRHGALAALGQVVGRVLAASQSADPTTSAGLTAVLEAASHALVTHVRSPAAELRAAACNSLAVVVRMTTLPIPIGEKSDNGITGTPTRYGLVAFLAAAAKASYSEAQADRKANPHASSDSSKLVEAVALALGALASHDADPGVQQAAIDSLLSLGPVPFEEAHFTIGQAIVEAATGRLPRFHDAPLGFGRAGARDATAAEDKSDYESSAFGHLPAILEEILMHKLESHDNTERNAAPVWLLALVHRAGDTPAIQARLLDLQAAFCKMLGERSQFTQEVAAKGLALVYEHGPKSMQTGLVDWLIDALTTGKRREIEGTTISAGVSAGGPAGTSLSAAGDSTYKQLCDFANEVGKPDLVYQFLALSSHHSLWHTRGGAGYGLEALLASGARDQLAPYMDALVPRLYRYQYDPSTRVAGSIGRLWQVLITDPKAAVDKHARAIMAELLTTMTSQNWRERQASYLGMTDLLQGRTAEDVGDQLDKVWFAVFKGVDDIKDTVREAAVTTLKTLGNLTMRLCDENNASSARIVRMMLPFLLEQGLVNEVKEVRGLTVHYVSEICKVAGAAVGPLVPLVVFHFLSAMSSFEAAELVMLQQHADGNTGAFQHGLSAEELERRRVSAVRGSILYEVLDRCLRQLRHVPLDQLVEKLVTLVRSGVGLPTRAATAKFIVQMTTTVHAALTPHASSLLKAVTTALEDNSPTIRSEYASAVAAVARVAKSASVKTLIARLIQMSSSNNATERATAGVAFLQLVRSAPDVIQRHLVDILPVLFMAQVDPDRTEAWADAWTEAVPSVEHVVRLYMNELITPCLAALDASDWATKRNAARAVTSLLQNGGTAIQPHALTLGKALMAAARGQMWDGKEWLMQALAVLIQTCPAVATSTPSAEQLDASKLVHLLKVEAGRSKASPAYRAACLGWLGTAVAALPKLDLFLDVLPTIVKVSPTNFASLQSLGVTSSEPSAGAGAAAGGDDAAAAAGAPAPEVIAAAYELLGNAWPAVHGPTQATCFGPVVARLCAGLTEEVWTTRLTILGAVEQLAKKSNTSLWTAESLQACVDAIVERGVQDDKYWKVRVAAVTALTTLLTSVPVHNDSVRAIVAAQIPRLQRDAEPRVVSAAQALSAALSTGSA